MCGLGAAHVLSGRAPSGVPLLIDGVAGYRSFGVKTAVPFYLSFLVEGHLAQGRVDLADATLRDAVRVLDESEESWNEPFVLMAKARLDQVNRVAAGDVAATIRTARERATEQGSFGVAALVARRAAELGITLP